MAIVYVINTLIILFGSKGFFMKNLGNTTSAKVMKMLGPYLCLIAYYLSFNLLPFFGLDLGMYLFLILLAGPIIWAVVCFIINVITKDKKG